MVNENLINLTNNKKPIETVQEIEKYEIKKSPLSLATKAKVINKSGSNYLSEDGESYGPCSKCGKSELAFKLEIILKILVVGGYEWQFIM